MGMVFIYGIIVLLLLALSAPIIYYILKRNGNAKLGKIIASVITIIVLCFAFTNQIDEILYFKSDVKNELKLVNVNLTEDYEIIKNEVIGFESLINPDLPVILCEGVFDALSIKRKSLGLLSKLYSA